MIWRLILVLAMTPVAWGATLQIVTTPYPPYQYEKNGEIVGFQADLVRAVYDRIGIPYEIQIQPWARAITAIERGNADALFGAYKTPEREEFADYTKEVLLLQQVKLFVKKGRDIEFTGDLEQLMSYSFGLVRKMSYGPRFDNALKNNLLTDLTYASDVDQNFIKLKSERFQILPSDLYVGYSQLNKHEMAEGFEPLETPIQAVPVFMIFSKQKSLTYIRDQVDQTIINMKKSGEYGRIISDYFQLDEN